MQNKEKLYETLGELLYIIAKADGDLPIEEKRFELEKLLEGHKFGRQILWSFNYEIEKNTPIEGLYNKALSYCQSNGPASEYEEFVSMMESIAAISDAITSKKGENVKSPAVDLIERFRNDMAKIKNF